MLSGHQRAEVSFFFFPNLKRSPYSLFLIRVHPRFPLWVMSPLLPCTDARASRHPLLPPSPATRSSQRSGRMPSASRQVGSRPPYNFRPGFGSRIPFRLGCLLISFSRSRVPLLLLFFLSRCLQEIVSFASTDAAERPIYHTNVVMAVSPGLFPWYLPRAFRVFSF